ncbi:MAG TPA: HEAT repeat domain-containing protein, partial [Planctomycetaceae bacterium]|nr:HEAT repeat domain-containing protein [Planctomycetaceae bacterium]
MSRLSLLLALALAVVCGQANTVLAQQDVDAQWIWFDAGNPADTAPAGKVWFRKEYKADEPSTGHATVACDDEFTLWVNGQKIGSGIGPKVYRFSLSGIVERGTNVFAVEAVNKSGKAGLLVDAEIRGQGGRKIPCDTGAEWKATIDDPQGSAWLSPRFDDTAWKPVKVIGKHGESPWKEISFATGELDRFQVAEGFELKQIAGKELVGSLIAMTWGNRGRLIVSREMGPILNVIDSDGDGTYDTISEYTDKLKNCQGLCMVFDDLYAVGVGPEGTGLYRLPDADHNDVADDVILVVKPKGGIGEHGPHDVVYGPDGWLYHNLGNHAWIQNRPESNTPCRNYEEGYLLEPAYEDAGGHAVGIPAPGGTVWRFTPDGKKWWAETVGFRNQYDIAFNQRGDLFTFDSDMEWDVNLPWYKPVRINHCIPGAEFGWRSGAKNWPAWYFDCLPATIDVGRGSPTGVVFYEHTQFPEKYRGALLNCDWSMGRIIVGFLKPQGASYSGMSENLVTGNPLNVSDIEVDRDGSVVFCTGGRRTEGGIYRITHIEGAKLVARTPKAETLEDALTLPQQQAAWSREILAGIKAKLGGEWVAGLSAKVFTGTSAEKVRALTLLTQHGPKPDEQVLLAAAVDADAGVRQFATLLLGDHPTPATASALAKLLTDKDPVVQRRACEAFVRTGLEAPVAPLIRLLASSDHWLRFAARLPLERVPTDKWRGLVLAHPDVNVQLSGLLALYRQGPEALPTKNALERLAPLLGRPLAESTSLDLRRML